MGDLLLAGPALTSVSRHFSGARFIGVGHRERWGLLAGTLPVAAVWDGGEAMWAALFKEQGALPTPLCDRLTGIDLALVFSPRPRPGFEARLVQAGVHEALWLPSFPQGGAHHVTTVQARRLEELGIEAVAARFRLRLEDKNLEEMTLDPGERLLVMAPGSGSLEKNWPLSSYYEVARALAWEGGLRVVWLAGPAEEPLLPYIQGLAAAQEQVVWVGEPLGRVAGLLSRTHLYLGGDSGITHLAAAAGARRVVALFGPTDPRIWSPLGEQVIVLTPPGGAGEKASLTRLAPETVLGRLRGLLG